ncbi:MAG TPA: restriction endonuclease subunit S [Melioribacteraceae bacterium]|nr:restriction endonuclease subunit S [Melioribacteraceae bacterium]
MVPNTTIGEIAKVRRGASPRPIGDPKYFGGEVGWVRISDVTKSQKYLKKTEQYVSPLGESLSVRVGPGALIMSICATIGRPIIIDMPACVHDGFVLFNDIKNTDIEFLYYILQFHEKDFEAKGQPGTQLNLNTTIVENFRIFHPIENEQRKIASILSSIDSVISKTETAIEKYKSIKQGLMQDLFTRGIDIKTGKIRQTYNQAPELYKQTKLGFIPKEWEIDTLKNITNLLTDGSHKSPKTSPSNYLIGNVKDMLENDFNYDSCTQISKEDFDFLVTQNCSPQKDDVLLSKDGTIGKIILFNGNRKIVVLSSIALLRCNEKVKPQFLYSYLKSFYFDRELLKFKTGSALTRVVIDSIRKMKITFPKDVSEQIEIYNHINSIENYLLVEQNTVKKYKSIKTGLMQVLLTGRKRVKVD